MNDFFSNQPGQSLEWFGLPHILLTLGFVISIVVLWILLPKLKDKSYEKWIRYFLIALVFLFEWRVFESRILTTSLFRLPLCAVALYALTYAIAFKKEKAFNIVYFYAFGSLLSFLFYDTPWGLDRWDGWTFFGAHACIAWLAVYGVRTLGYTPNKKNLYQSMIFLAVYAFVSGYATFKFGGSDELFLFTPPVDFLVALQDIHPLLYLLAFSAFVVLMLILMYLPYFKRHKLKNK
ncbi:MAG TPA: YwaF family protein [Bacilli bacterium]|nr:YwaF family protein [Bacilli bacterium]